MYKKQVIVIVGAGGIGSNLFQKITRYAPMEWDILLIDGDVVEEKNILRQVFTIDDVSYNKAVCLTRKANNTLRERNTAYPNYLKTKDRQGAEQLNKLTEDYREIILFGCVDNHAARRQMEYFFEDFEGGHILYIDGANGEYDGDVVSVYKSEVGISGACRSMYDGSVLTDNDNDPNNKSCNAKLDEGNIQTLIANDSTAIVMLGVFHKYLNKEIFTGLWRFDECIKHKL